MKRGILVSAATAVRDTKVDGPEPKSKTRSQIGNERGFTHTETDSASSVSVTPLSGKRR